MAASRALARAGRGSAGQPGRSIAARAAFIPPPRGVRALLQDHSRRGAVVTSTLAPAPRRGAVGRQQRQGGHARPRQAGVGLLVLPGTHTRGPAYGPGSGRKSNGRRGRQGWQGRQGHGREIGRARRGAWKEERTSADREEDKDEETTQAQRKGEGRGAYSRILRGGRGGWGIVGAAAALK